MKHMTLGKLLAALLSVASMFIAADAGAATGYMGFLSSTTAPSQGVTTGDAASYMRVGRDWPEAQPLNNGVAQPTLQQLSTIKSWRDASNNLRFRFEIPDWTTKQFDGSSLIVGDKVIIQIDPNPPGGTELGHGGAALTNDHRFEVTIVDSQVIDIDGVVSPPYNKPKSYVPYLNIDNNKYEWDTGNPQTTAATATLTVSIPDPLKKKRIYALELSIPLSELGNPTSDVGLAIAIVNDLGHHTGSGGSVVHEATGTAFPMTMGIAPGSEPGLVNFGGVASGAWIRPETWGIGYFSLATTSPDVTFRQDDDWYISKAIRIGKCNANWDDIGEVTLGNWQVQNTIQNWYEYNPPGTTSNPPCRMGIWMDANVNFSPTTTPGVVKKRFLVVWGRPGIAPQEWYFAGITEPVAITAPHTPVSFVWNNVAGVNFLNNAHPCMRVYILPEILTQAEVDTIKAIDTQAELAAMESTYSVAGGSNKSTQMNFTNIGLTGGCKENACTVLELGGENRHPLLASLTDPLFIADVAVADVKVGGPGNPEAPGTTRERPPVEKPESNLVRITAMGFGVAEPVGKQRYVYVEELGGLAWAVPSKHAGTIVKDLRFEVTNPKLATKIFVGRKAIEIPSRPRRMFVAMEAVARPGTPIPRLDTKMLGQILRGPLEPGNTVNAQVGVEVAAEEPPCSPTSCGPCKKVALTTSGGWELPGALVLVGGIAGVGGFAFRRRKRREGDRGQSS